MPLITLKTSVTLSDNQRTDLLAALSRVVAEGIGKSEQYVMVTIDTASLMMSGKPGDAAFVDVRSIGGLDRNVNGKLSQKICALLDETLGIAPNRVYINFANMDAANWGWNRNTFG